LKRPRLLVGTVFGGLAAMGVTLFALQSSEHPTPRFKEYCARCHGEDGRAQTPKGKRLKAQDFTDSEWQSAKSDADLIKTVTKGGEDMPAFGRKLTKEQIESLVKDDVRGFGKKDSR